MTIYLGGGQNGFAFNWGVELSELDKYQRFAAAKAMVNAASEGLGSQPRLVPEEICTERHLRSHGTRTLGLIILPDLGSKHAVCRDLDLGLISSRQSRIVPIVKGSNNLITLQ